MKNAGDKSLWCLRPMGRALAGWLGCLGLAALAAGCGAEPTPEEEAADRAALSAPEPAVPAARALSALEPAVPAAHDFVKPPRIPIARPALPSPPSAAPIPSPFPILRPREAFALPACPRVREQRGGVVLDHGCGAPSRAPRAPCDPADRLDSEETP